MLMTSGTHVCPRKDIVCGEKPENWCGECPLGRADPLRDLVAALRREADRLDQESRRFKERSAEESSAYFAAIATAKRDAADRIEAALDESKGRQG